MTARPIRAVGGILVHLVGPGCLDAICGYVPARGWAAPERSRYRRNCRECKRLAADVQGGRVMSLIDAEMSRLKGIARVAERKYEALRKPSTELARFFISKTTNLVTMRCDYCCGEWVRDCSQEHDGDCPVGLVLAALEPTHA